MMKVKSLLTYHHHSHIFPTFFGNSYADDSHTLGPEIALLWQEALCVYSAIIQVRRDQTGRAWVAPGKVPQILPANQSCKIVADDTDKQFSPRSGRQVFAVTFWCTKHQSFKKCLSTSGPALWWWHGGYLLLLLAHSLNKNKHNPSN